LYANLDTVDAPLNQLDEKTLCPGSAALDKINSGLAVGRELVDSSPKMALR
jgi:hypothetical protein